jgi:hypothetical protein
MSIGPIVDTIILDSKDRESQSTSSSDFLIRLPQAGKKVRYFRFRKVIFPLNMDNVTSSTNTIELDDVASNTTVGLYNITSLMDTMTAAIANYTFELLDNNRVKVTNTLAAAFKFEPLEMAGILGFTQASYTLATSYTAENAPDLLIDEYYTLHSNFIAERQHHTSSHSDRRSGTVLIIPNYHNVGDNLVWGLHENPVDKWVNDTNSNIIDFQIKNQAGTVIDIQSKSVSIIIDRMG